MSHHLLGQLSALGAAVTWALAVVLFKKSGERLPPVALNLFKNVVGLVLLAAPMLGEALTRRKMLAAALALTGVVVVTMG